LAQQVTTRQSAILLAYSINMPLEVNLVPRDLEIAEAVLIKDKPKIDKLLDIAYNHRPELREYELFRLAAARDVQIGFSPLYPTVSMFLAYTRASLTFSGPSAGLSGVAVTQISGGGTGSGGTSNTALGQTASLSPGNNLTATGGANTSSAQIVASSGGTPIANTQSGSLVTSGAVAPSIIGPISVSGSSSSNINGTNTSSFGTAPGLFNTLQAGLSINWSLSNFGAVNAANIVALRSLSRQSYLQANQQITLITEQVRADYLNALTTVAQVESTGSLLDANEEALRLASLRMKVGQGTVIELEQAKSQYLSSLVTEAQSIIASKQAEAQLLHDIGVISVDTLTKGFSANDVPRLKRKR
jgi:outer membrane protein TolC